MFSPTDVFRLILGVIFITPALSRGYGSHSSSSSHSTSHRGGYQSHSYPTGGHQSSLSGHGTFGSVYGNSHNEIHRTEPRPVYATDRGTHSQQATYPGTTGISGNQRINGANTHNTHVNHKETVIHNTHVEHHHHYSPPSHVTYGAVAHPVYVGSPPVYIYQYRESGSRFDNLLTGLALYNLGRMSANSHSHYHDDHYYNPQTERYRPRYNDEVCRLRIERSNGGIDETRVPCEAMSSYILQDSVPASSDLGKQSVTTRITNTVVNVTKTQSSNTPNNSINSTSPSANTVVTTTVQNTTTVVDALQAKGPSLQVSPDMKCYMIHIYGGSSKKQWPVDCGLLQAYAESSFSNSASYRNSAGRNIHMHQIAILLFVLSFS